MIFPYKRNIFNRGVDPGARPNARNEQPVDRSMWFIFSAHLVQQDLILLNSIVKFNCADFNVTQTRSSRTS